MARVAAIILAAGASTRMGVPKQLLRLHDETLLARAIRIAGEAGLAPVMVVLGANAAEIVAGTDMQTATPIINSDWEEGMGSSIRAGAQALPPGVEGAVVKVCDQPAVTADHLRALAACGGVTASSYAGRHGVPAFFPAWAFPQLLTLQGDAGARTLLQGAPAIALPGGELDIDTPADLYRAAAPGTP